MFGESRLLVESIYRAAYLTGGRDRRAAIKIRMESSIGKHLSSTRRQDAPPGRESGGEKTFHRLSRDDDGPSRSLAPGGHLSDDARPPVRPSVLAPTVLVIFYLTLESRGAVAFRIPTRGTILGDSISPANRIPQSSNPDDRMRRSRRGPRVPPSFTSG